MSDTSQVHHPSSQADHETQLLWTHVVNSKRKGNNKTQQSIVSFQPYSYQSSGHIAVIRPFLKGIEQDSVFIGLAPVKDRNLLNKALLKFNEASITDGMYEDFLGYRSKSSLWTPHCGIVSLNNNFTLTSISEGIDGG
ncbi:unnamed protein product [Mucor fragilis]